MDLKTAKEFAARWHKGQTYGKSPFIKHLEDVERVLVRFLHHGQTLRIAAWLHDTLEDTECSFEELAATFGPEIACLVHAVSDEPGNNRFERKFKTYTKIKANSNAITLKLADRIANVEASIARKSPLLEMYRKEMPKFREMLYIKGHCEEMWEALEALFKNS